MTLRRARLAPNRRRERRGVWVLLAVLLAAAGIVAVLWRPVAPALGLDTPLASFPSGVLDVIDAYRGPRYLGAAASLGLTLLVPFLFAATRRGRRAIGRLAGPRAHAPGRAAVIGAVVAVATVIARLPLAVWLGYVRDGDWGFRTADLATWASDQAVGAAGTVLAYAVGAALLTWAAGRWPRSWPYRLTVAGTALTAALALVHPLVIAPLTLPTRPLEDGPLRDAVTEVVEGAGFGDVPVVVGDASSRTTRVNAFVSGIGPTRRIVLYDTLAELPVDRVAYVVAHELAHREHRDLPRGVLLGAAGLLAGLLALGRVLGSPGTQGTVSARAQGDPRLIPLAVTLAVLGQIVALPVVTWVSRTAEASADARALELTGDPVAMIATNRTFVLRDLADPDPPGWVVALFGSHPSPSQRIRLAAGVAARDGIPLPAIDELGSGEADHRHPRLPEAG